MKRVSLKQVVQKCVWEPAFFRKLLKNPGGSLDRAGMQLSAKDLRKLKKLMADKKSMRDFEKYSRLVRKYAQTPQGLLW